MGAVQPPTGLRDKVALTIVAIDLVLFYEFIIRQMAEDVEGLHAVDHVEVKKPVLVEIAKLARPGPAGRFDPARPGRIHIVAVTARHLQHIGHVLRITLNLMVRHVVHHRLPLVHDLGAIGIRKHIGGEDLPAAVIVDISAVKAHRTHRRCGKGLRGLPATVAGQPDIVTRVEIVAHHNIGPAVSVHVRQLQGQGLRLIGQPGACKRAAIIAVKPHPGPVGPGFYGAGPVQKVLLLQRGVVGSRDQIQVTVLVKIGQIEAVGRGPQLRQVYLLKASRARIAPVENASITRGYEQVQPAIAIDVNRCNGARAVFKQDFG